MDVEQNITESLAPSDAPHQDKETENVNGSEDEGIFLSRIPHGGNSLDGDTNAEPAFSDETKSVGHNPVEEGDDVTKSRMVVLDDDSDDDSINKSLLMGKRKTTILSDDEDSGEPQRPIINRQALDSDDDKNDNIVNFKKKRIIRCADSDSEDDDALFFAKREPSQDQPKPNFKYNSNLFDAELSDEEDPARTWDDDHTPVRPRGSDDDDDGGRSHKGKKKKVGKQTAAKKKNQQQQITEIQSETQRMVRESQVSLPYHRPKQRTLAEFLNRRKKTSLPHSDKRTNLKMSMRNMEALRLLEEKKKEVEEFYKPDSDQEDPDDKDWSPHTAAKSQELSDGEMDLDIKSEVDKITNQLTIFPDDDDELPDLSRVIGDSSSTRAMDEDLPVEELQTPATLVTEKSTVGEEGPSLVSSTGKNDDSGICNSESLVGDQTQVGDTAMEDEGVGSSAPVFSTPSGNEGEGNVQNNEANVQNNEVMEGKERKDNVDNDKVTRMEVEGDSEGKLLPLALDNLSLLSKTTVGSEPVKFNSPKPQLLDGELDKTETPKLNLLKSPETPKLSLMKSQLNNTDTPKLNVAEDEINKTETPKLNILALKIPGVDLTEIIKTTPKLSLGGDDDFIDLEEETTTPKMIPGVSELMSRFARHSAIKRKKPAGKQQVNMSIVQKEKDDNGEEKLVSSNLVITLDAEEDDGPKETVPGARLVSLKMALQAKIREQREQHRMRRVKEKQFMETEQVIHDYQDDGGLPDEEAELTDQSDTEYETESEPEENDVIIKDKKRRKNAFCDDEAEEDDDADDQAGEVDDEVNDNDDNNDDDDVSPEAEGGDSNDTVEMPQTRKKITVNDDDDNEKLHLQWEESEDVNSIATTNSSLLPAITRSSTEDLFASQTAKKADNVYKDTSTMSMDSSFELFGSVIPGHQPGGGMRHSRGSRPSEGDGDNTFLTPFIKLKSGGCSSIGKERNDLSLPIEDSLDSCSAAPANTTSLSPCGLSLHLTQLEESQFPLQKSQKETSSVAKLRLDFTDIGNCQENDDLIGLCSGQFTGTAPSSQANDLYEEGNVSPTQDINELMGLCTGRFGGEPREVEKKAGVMSRLVTSSSNLDYGHHTDDDELLNLCTAKFTTQTSQENSSSAAADMEKPGNQLEDVESRPVPDMIVYSSDEENDMHRQAKLKIRKKRRRIMQFSDDEDAQDAIEYDDEENEIRRTTFSGFKDKMKGGIRADFLENEAELSGSDLNSDDEEDGEDVMEMEEGDYEHFDENDLRNQVGRAHLKNVLDSDKRELRLLQEMYLEDGELHGEGRQRQFRWKNMGDDEEGNERKAMSDEEGVEEEGEDVDWRKQRIEREKFLKEQKTKVEDNEAQVFKLGRRSIVRSTSLIVDPASKREPLQEVNRPPAKIPQITKNLPPLLPKRGSFLARDKVTLARIAELTKARGAVVGGAKQAGNFVFQQLSAEEVQKKVESTKVMKAHGLPASKRPRVDRSFSSMDITSQSSSIFKYL